VVQIPPLVEQVRSEAAALDGLQELLGNDGVGVNVGAVDRQYHAVDGSELVHGVSMSAF
jgi:hypothetical protein